jgi:isoleucyl-tRNA synthetase
LISETKSETSSNSLKPIPASYKPKELENGIRANWKVSDIRNKISTKFAGKKRLGYVEGPPTLNGEPHMGHLRGRIMKDLWYRFSTMSGLNIDFRGGWDCQGLPVELQAEKELGLTGNKTANLKKIGEEALVAECKRMVDSYHKIWTETDDWLGLMINDEKAYWTFRDSYIEREWQILRSAWEHGILEEGFRVTPFCPNCQTSLSAAEVALGGYETLEDPSMYFKMKLRGKEEGSYLIAWTTMPFTVVTDELVGVKPDSDYHFIEVSSKSSSSPERWLVGAERLEGLMKELRIEKFTVKETLKGRDLEGLRYEHPFANDVPKQEELDQSSSLVHSIVSEEFVDTSTGSGLVHMSPSNGEEDFEVSQRRKIQVFNPIDSQAVFNNDAGTFSGLFVRDADQKVGELLKESGLLLQYGKLKHEYPVCWRSGHRLVWLSRREYYYFVDRLKELAVDAAQNVEYYFDQPRNRFLEIIKEKRPWCISRERIWGSPLPIWKCEKCGERVGLFSRKEIVEHAQTLPDGDNFELHRPWIDRIIITCSKCKGNMQREPFVLDTWHNSGAAPYASLTDEEHGKYIPVPFLTEGIDQTRGWAYTLLLENVLLSLKPKAPYEAFLFQGLVLDEKGQKMSKSKGNYIAARNFLQEQSVDLVRLYLMWKAGPIDSINFSLRELSGRPYQILSTLYHMHVFYLQNSLFDGFKTDSKSALTKLKKQGKDIAKQDRWLLSRLEFLIDFCTENYSRARYQEAARAMESFLIENLSQTYIPIVRNEMWEESETGRKRRQTIYGTLGLALLTCDKLLHPISPFLTDYLAGNCFGTESLLLEDWPSAMGDLRNEKLEVEFDLMSKLVSLTNAARMKARVKRRWPLHRAIYLVNEDSKDLILANKDLLLEQTNLASIELSSDPKDTPLVLEAKINHETVAAKAKQQLQEVADYVKKADSRILYLEISSKGKAKLAGIHGVELDASDLEFSFSTNDPKFVVVENYGMVVALDTSRDEELIARGLLRDIARNIQALRKEKGFNPTDVLEFASVAGLGKQNVLLLQDKKTELAFLVRVKRVELYSDLPESSSSWPSADVDGMQIRIHII